MPDQSKTVGDLVAACLEECGVATAFGVISIHNMPILDAFARRNRIRFVPARGEAGALNMADSFARVTGGLGVGVTSTGIGAGNAGGSVMEAQIAGTPLIHLTGTIESDDVDKGRANIHEFVRQPEFLKSVSKAYLRIAAPQQTLGIMREAVRIARTPPMGPVSVEIPIDVQKSAVDWPDEIAAPKVPTVEPDPAALDELAARVAAARRPMLWLGGGARHAEAPARRLADLGLGIVTSIQGRGVVPETHKMSLGAFNATPVIEDFYGTCDLILVVGSRLRGNETLRFKLKLPANLLQADIDPSMQGRAYPTKFFVHGDAALVLDGLARRLAGKLKLDPAFAGDLAAAKHKAVAALHAALGANYTALADAVRQRHKPGAPFVRDITLSNSLWGNRYLELGDSRQGVHSLGGAIGQGLAMAVGAALGRPQQKTVLLSGDGGFMLNVGELATAAQERAPLTIVLMNDLGYGVIRNIWDAGYGGRRAYADLTTPDFAGLAASLKVWHRRVGTIADFAAAFDAAQHVAGPAIVEVDMTALGPFAQAFAGPPVRKPA